MELLASSTVSIPEIVYDVPFSPAAGRVAVTPIARHLPWDVFAHKLRLDPEEFQRRAEGGEFGPAGVEGCGVPADANTALVDVGSSCSRRKR
jgi:hypothetical protein